MAFDISSVLKGAAAKTAQEQIVYLQLDDLVPDPNNFYTLEGIEDLADNIATIGLQQPIRVRPGAGGRYIVVSGHRRRAACMKIRDGNDDSSHMFDAGVPCIIDDDACSDSMRQLRLIYANSSTRVMTPAEIAKQAEQVEMLLYKLKEEEDVKFPGRMRDHVAKACNVSKTKLARLHAIRNNLVPELMPEFEAGRLNESVAYRISQEKPGVQKQLAERTGPSIRDYDINRVETAIETVKNPRPTQPVQFDGKGHIEWDAGEYLEKLHQEDDEYYRMLKDAAVELIRRMPGFQSRREGIEQLKNRHGKSHHGWSTEVGFADASPKGLTLENYKTRQKILRTWTEVYDLLSVYVLNRAEKFLTPQVSKPDTATPAWNRDPEPPKEGRYLCLVDMNTTALHEQRCDWRGGMWHAFGMPLQDLFTVVAWWPLPEEAPHPEWWSGMDDDEEEEGDE